jgi:integrase
MKSINVSVFRKTGRTGFHFIWKDPRTGKRRTKASGESKKRNAERAAADFEDELNRRAAPDLILWEDFVFDYDRQVLKHAASGTAYAAYAAFKHFTAAVKCERLEQVPGLIGAFRLALLDNPNLAPTTQTGYLKHFRSAMNWAHEQGLLVDKVKIKMPPSPETEMKGRPLTDVEYRLMLMTGLDLYGQTMEDFLIGLWWSGLRRGEAMKLSWNRDDPFAIDQAGEYWRFRIRNGAQKSKRAQLAPMAPEFCEWLEGRKHRKGLVFGPLGKKGERMRADTTGKAVSEIGEAAGIVTDEAVDRHATCHDFRRSFGDRWSRELSVVDLKAMMRHKSIDTTMKYYVGRDVDSISARLRAITERKRFCND